VKLINNCRLITRVMLVISKECNHDASSECYLKNFRQATMFIGLMQEAYNVDGKLVILKQRSTIDPPRPISAQKFK